MVGLVIPGSKASSITCHEVDKVLPSMEGMYDNIQKILNEYGYTNIKIFTTLPDAKDLNLNQ